MSDSELEDPAVSRFRDYLRIKTISLLPGSTQGPKPDYESAVKFLAGMAEEIGLAFQCIEVAPEKPVVVLTWEGTQPGLKSIMLNSHIDVVPVDPEKWSCDPFAAHKTENGDIIARGSQDMKCVGMWYLEAVRRLKAAGQRLSRTLHLTYVPDEEVGGREGMKLFVKTPQFQTLNVGFALDEGLANPTEAFRLFYAERAAWWFTIRCPGNPGHGSRFIEGTAAEKVQRILSKLMEFRESQKRKLETGHNLSLGDVTSVNVTMLSGGVQYNVAPSEMCIGVDMRITPTDNHKALQSQLEQWVKQAGNDCSIEYNYQDLPSPIVSTDPSDPWWRAFSAACEKHHAKLELEILSVATDSRYLRHLGIPALGFSPINHTPILLHDHNEFLNERVYLRGIGVYQDILQALASVTDTD